MKKQVISTIQWLSVAVVCGVPAAALLPFRGQPTIGLNISLVIGPLLVPLVIAGTILTWRQPKDAPLRQFMLQVQLLGLALACVAIFLFICFAFTDWHIG